MANYEDYKTNKIFKYSDILVNGNMLINQAGATNATLSGGGTLEYYQFDNIKSTINSASTPGSFSVADGGTLGNYSNSLLITCVDADVAFSANDFYSGCQVPIEGFDALQLINQQLTLDFIFKASGSGNYGIVFANKEGTYTIGKSFNYTNVGNPEIISFEIDTVLAEYLSTYNNSEALSVYIAAVGGSGFNTAGITWASSSGNSFVKSGSLYNWMGATGRYVQIGGVHLQVSESNSNNNPYKDYQDELLLCKRFYREFDNIAGGQVNDRDVDPLYYGLKTLILDPPMRDIPDTTEPQTGQSSPDYNIPDSTNLVVYVKSCSSIAYNIPSLPYSGLEQNSWCYENKKFILNARM